MWGFYLIFIEIPFYMKTIWKLIIGLIILILIIFITYKAIEPEKKFNQVNLSHNNTIINEILPRYYDTILNVALDSMEIKNQVVIIRELPETTKNSLPDMELYAHIVYRDGYFYLFISNFDREKSIRILAHEVIHIDQYLKKDLIYNDGILLWENKSFDLNEINYQDRPWEVDAFYREGELMKLIKNGLYE